MPAAVLGTLLLLAGQVSLDVQSAGVQLDPAFREQLSSDLGRLISERTGMVVRSLPACQREGSCAAQEPPDRDQVEVRVFRGATQARLLAHRRSTFPGGPWSSQVDLPLSGPSYEDRLRVFVSTLFPEPTLPGRGPRLVAEMPEGTGSSTLGVVSWISAGIGVAAGVTGIAFALSSANAVDDPPDPFTFEEQDEKRRSHRTVAIVLFGAAVTGLGVAALLASLDD